MSKDIPVYFLKYIINIFVCLHSICIMDISGTKRLYGNNLLLIQAKFQADVYEFRACSN